MCKHVGLTKKFNMFSKMDISLQNVLQSFVETKDTKIYGVLMGNQDIFKKAPGVNLYTLKLMDINHV